MLLKCKTPGTYVLASGAGPLNTSSSCVAVHCELFGGASNREGAPPGGITGNNEYNGTTYSAAILATIEVGTCIRACVVDVRST